MTLSDDTEIVYSQIIDVDGVKKVIVHFECPTERGFDSARCELPDYKWILLDGFFSRRKTDAVKEFVSASKYLLKLKNKIK